MNEKAIKLPICLSSRGVWVDIWLREYTLKEEDGEVMGIACTFHRKLLKAYQYGAGLFSQKNGSKPFPIHLLSPAKTIQLPPEADAGESEEFSINFEEDTYPAFIELMCLTNVKEPSTAIENALCLHYDILSRFLRSETFFALNGETSQLEQVRLVA